MIWSEGLSIIDEALGRSERNEERWCVAEFLRIKGELILREGAPQAATAAEGHFLHSLDWARRQGALSWELRTSTRLARLQHRQGRTQKARELLTPVYDRARPRQASESTKSRAGRGSVSAPRSMGI
jgi:predicted ATPase